MAFNGFSRDAAHFVWEVTMTQWFGNLHNKPIRASLVQSFTPLVLVFLWPGRLPQSRASLTASQGVAGSRISTVSLPLPLIQEGQMSVSGKSMCTKYWLTV